MTAKERHVAYNREWRAVLRAHGLCIDCRDDHPGPGMRCEPCAEYNRGGPRQYPYDYAKRLRHLNLINTESMTRAEQRRIYHARYYCKRKIAEKTT